MKYKDIIHVGNLTDELLDKNGFILFEYKGSNIIAVVDSIMNNLCYLRYVDYEGDINNVSYIKCASLLRNIMYGRKIKITKSKLFGLSDVHYIYIGTAE